MQYLIHCYFKSQTENTTQVTIKWQTIQTEANRKALIIAIPTVHFIQQLFTSNTRFAFKSAHTDAQIVKTQL